MFLVRESVRKSRIEKQKEQLEKERLLEEKRIREKTAHIEELKKKISEKFEYVMRCMDYLALFRIEYEDIVMENGMSLDTCLNDSDNLEQYWDCMCSLIRDAHKEHNNNLVADCPDCFGYDTPWDEDADYCFAYANDHRTHGCGMKVYLDTSNVDFMNDLTLDSTDPCGYIA